MVSKQMAESFVSEDGEGSSDAFSATMQAAVCAPNMAGATAGPMGLQEGMERPYIPFEGPLSPMAAEAMARAAALQAAGSRVGLPSPTPRLDHLHGKRCLDKLGMPLWRQILWESTIIADVSEEISHLVEDKLREHHGWEEGRAPEDYLVDSTNDVSEKLKKIVV